jgi:hypothetical protein
LSFILSVVQLHGTQRREIYVALPAAKAAHISRNLRRG